MSEFFAFHGSPEGSRMGAGVEDLVHHRDNKGKNFSVSHQILECQVTLNLVLVGHDSLSTEEAGTKRTQNQQSLTQKMERKNSS